MEENIRFSGSETVDSRPNSLNASFYKYSRLSSSGLPSILEGGFGGCLIRKVHQKFIKIA